MKNTFKRTMALALAVVMLLSVSVIGVSAVNEDVSIVKDVMTDTVAVYRFHQERYENDYMVDTDSKPAEAAVVKSNITQHYEAGEMNWKLYDDAHGYSVFNSRDLYEITVGEGAEYGHSNYHMMVLRAPKKGTYNFALNYGVTNSSAASGVKVYLFPESVLTAFTVDGTNWKYLVTNNREGVNGVDLLGRFNCKDESIADDEYRVETFETTYTFNGEETYYLVCAATDDDETTKIGSNKIYLSHLSLEKTSVDSANANVKAYDFYYQPSGTAYSGTWYNNSQTIYNNYDTSGWRYEAASALYQMNNSNLFNSTTASMRFFSSANNWYAIRIKAPAAGTYNVTLDYGQVENNNGVGDVYMFPASALDATLNLAELDKEQAAVAALLANSKLTENDLTLAGEAAADKLGALQGADMFSTIERANADKADTNGGNGINNYLEGKINTQLAAVTCTTLFTGIQYYNESNTNAKASETSSTTVTFPAAGDADYSDEYIVVFKLTSGSNLYNSKLAFTEIVDNSVAEIENPESVSADFYIADLDGKTIAVAAATIKDAYDEGTLNWRYEAASAVYQMTRNNEIYSTVDGIQFYNGVKNAWFAVRVKSPGTGEYNVSVDHATYAEGAQSVSGYLLDASAVDAAINAATGGNNAADYAEQQSADPYQDNTNDVGTYNAYYKTAIESLLTNATSVFAMNCYSAENATSVSTTGTYSFVEGKEYVLVLQANEISPTPNKGHIVFSELNLVPTVSYESAGKYDSFRAALAAAEADEKQPTVKLLSDIEAADLGVTCDIDLNGNCLTVYGDMTSVAAVSDSKDGEGVLTVTGEMILAGTQAQLPLYDAAVNGCRLYSVTWGDNNQSKAAGNNAKKFWFQLYFDNTAAYDLIASGTSGLSIGVVLDWGTDSKAFDFVEGTAAAFAAGWGEFMKTAETPWLWVNVLNVVEGLTVAPVVEANGARITCGAIA